ncbi:unnamed protein product [Urochloa decumbens]|uniref:ALOG domain-containing protein n=1 Tax=Urochloa decumbens TaxID=240449 RepID=A0ABC9FMM3_9POAL
MSTGGGGGAEEEESLAPERRPSRYESQKRRDWQTFTRYLGAHRPPLQLRRCSGAHVLEFLRYLDRFGKTRVHAPPCPSYGGGAGRLAPSSSSPAAEAAACQCPLRQAWGSLDALVGRLRAAFDERHGPRGSVTAPATETATAPPDSNAAGVGCANPFAARAVRLYLRDVRDAQSRARGISYTRKKKKRSKPPQQGQQGSTICAAAKHDGGAAGCARAHGMNSATTTASMAPPAVPPPPHPHPIVPPLPPAYLTGVPFECCDHGGVFEGGASATASGGFYLPLLFNTFG